MATEENVNPTEGQEQENDYRETLLVRNPDSGQVEAVSKLVTKGSPRGAYRAASCEEPSGVLSVPEQQCRGGFHPRFQIPEGQSDPVSVFESARLFRRQDRHIAGQARQQSEERGGLGDV